MHGLKERPLSGEQRKSPCDLNCLACSDTQNIEAKYLSCSPAPNDNCTSCDILPIDCPDSLGCLGRHDSSRDPCYAMVNKIDPSRAILSLDKMKRFFQLAVSWLMFMHRPPSHPGTYTSPLYTPITQAYCPISPPSCLTATALHWCKGSILIHRCPGFTPQRTSGLPHREMITVCHVRCAVQRSWRNS